MSNLITPTDLIRPTQKSTAYRYFNKMTVEHPNNTSYTIWQQIQITSPVTRSRSRASRGLMILELVESVTLNNKIVIHYVYFKDMLLILQVNMSSAQTEMLLFIHCTLLSCHTRFYILISLCCLYFSINRLQRIQNSAARIVTNTRKYDHITPILQKLHWLPVRQRIHSKILFNMYVCVCSHARARVCVVCVGVGTHVMYFIYI